VSITVSSKFANVDVSPNGPTRAVLDNLPSSDQAKAVTLIREHLIGALDELTTVFQNPEELQRHLHSVASQEETAAVG